MGRPVVSSTEHQCILILMVLNVMFYIAAGVYRIRLLVLHGCRLQVELPQLHKLDINLTADNNNADFAMAA